MSSWKKDKHGVERIRLGEIELSIDKWKHLKPSYEFHVTLITQSEQLYASADEAKIAALETLRAMCETALAELEKEATP